MPLEPYNWSPFEAGLKRAKARRRSWKGWADAAQKAEQDYAAAIGSAAEATRAEIKALKQSEAPIRALGEEFERKRQARLKEHDALKEQLGRTKQRLFWHRCAFPFRWILGLFSGWKRRD